MKQISRYKAAAAAVLTADQACCVLLTQFSCDAYLSEDMNCPESATQVTLAMAMKQRQIEYTQSFSTIRLTRY
jgi:hypothetical protein